MSSKRCRGSRERSSSGAPAAHGRAVTGRRLCAALCLAGGAIAAWASLASGSPAPVPDTWTFVSNPSVHPVRVRVLRTSAAVARGDIFVAPIGNLAVPHSSFVGQRGPLIIDGDGQPVWQGTVPPGEDAMNFEPQRYQGQPVLTWWQGQLQTNGVGNGEDVIVDRHYQTVAIVQAEKGWFLDPHDFDITPQGSALFIEDKPVPLDLSAYGGASEGTVIDDVVVEEDIQTHRMLHRWDSLRHVSLAESYGRPPTGRAWDVFHMNSVSVEPTGQLLISLRNTSALYSVGRKTGRIYWRLGGKDSDFAVDERARFARQHDARFVKNGEITLFDNEGPPGIHLQSRGLLIRVDARRRTASLVHAYTHPQPALLSGSQGSTELLPNGDAFIGWGQMPFISEFSPAGALRLDLEFPGRDETYRAFRFPWSGQPSWPPNLALRGAGGGLVAYASWNGSTDVARWQILSGPTPETLAPVAGAPRGGFETAVGLATSDGPYFASRALDAQGGVLGTSAVVKRN